MGAIRAIVQKINEDGSIEAYETAINELSDYYLHLDCNLFDLVYWTINGVEVSVYCDDEGMLKSGNYGRYLLNERGVRLIPIFGNIIVVGMADEEGETLSLDSRIECKDVMKATETYAQIYGVCHATLITK